MSQSCDCMGREFQAEGLAKAKTLKKKCARQVQGPGKRSLWLEDSEGEDQGEDSEGEGSGKG